MFFAMLMYTAVSAVMGLVQGRESVLVHVGVGVGEIFGRGSWRNFS